MFRVGFYVDGFNLYHAVNALDEPALKWLDIQSLARSYTREIDRLERVSFFTAFNTWDPGKRQRHVNYVTALEAVGVDVCRSKFDTVDKWCRDEQKYCRFKEEKQTDTSIAVAILADCYEKRIDRIFLLSADSDQIPLARHIQERFPEIRFFLIAPPGRLAEARELGKHARKVFELTAGRLREHPLPNDIRDGRGRLIAQRPALYGPRD
jgi:uncharacterized LabA/DUF88 family protein